MNQHKINKMIKQGDDVEISIEENPQSTKNIVVHVDKKRDLVSLKIYGGIDSPDTYINEIIQLEKLSREHSTLEVTLNSPGGDVNTMVDLLSVYKLYNYVITIGKGEIASAAFVLWSKGDLRVVDDYSIYMAHRESYFMYGKTDEHIDAATNFAVIYEELFEDCFGGLLTPEEKHKATRSETWITHKDLISRPNVISIDDYLEVPNPYMIHDLVETQSGEYFLYDETTQLYHKVKLDRGKKTIKDLTAYLYGLETPSKK